MAKYEDDHGIRCFAPDDTETKVHIANYMGATLQELLEVARSSFGEDVSLSDISITSEHIHTRCLGFDAYDPDDWTDYLVLEINPQTH